MTLQDYKTKIRTYRGHLKSMDDALEEIYTNGCEEFIIFSLESKRIGVSKMATLATSLNHHKQQAFLIWLALEKRTLNEINSKMLELI